MSETAIIEKAGIYDGKLGKLVFTCEGGGAVSTDSSELEIEKAGIRINLMRIALINRTSKFAPLMLEGLGKNDFMPLETPEGVPKINISNYTYAGTMLRPGYIYVINECDNTKFSEWEVSLGGSLTEIHNDLASKDIREPKSDAATIDGYIAQQEDVLWFAFSEIQWSASYWDCIRNDNAKRDQRMQKFDCPKHDGNQSQNGVATYNVMQNNTLFAIENRIGQSKTQHIFSTAKFDDENNNEDFRPDAMFCLHDQVGILEELSSYLKYLWLRMDCLLITLKTGLTINEVENSLRNCISPETLKDRKTLEQIEALHNIAVNLKGVAYANDDNYNDLIDEWGGIDVDRLNAILAVTERKELKEKIVKARECLIEFSNSDYYGKIIGDFIENSNDGIGFGKLRMSELLSQIGLMPNDRDAYMDTKKELKRWQSKDDKGKQFILDVIDSKNHIGLLFNAPTVFEEVEAAANYLKFIAIADGMLEFGKTIFTEGDEAIRRFNNMMNTTRTAVNKVVSETAFTVTTIGKEFRKTELGSSRFVKKSLNINKKSLKAFKKLSNRFTGQADDFLQTKQITLSAEFEKLLANDPEVKLNNLQDSPSWLRIMRGLSVINLTLTAAALRKNGNKYENNLAVSKFGVAVVEVYVLVGRHYQAELKIGKKVVKRSFEKYSAKILRGSAYVAVLIDAAEAGLNYRERDYDAAIVYSGAAVAGLAGLLITGGFTNCWNPAGPFLLVLGVAMGFIAVYFEDSPLQRIAKNGVFGPMPTSLSLAALSDFSLTKPDVVLEGDYISKINTLALPENRNILIGSLFEDWRDYRKQYKDLMDILISGRIHFFILEKKEITPEEFNKQGMDIHKHSDREKLMQEPIKTLAVNINFGGYLYHEDQLEWDLYILENGLGNGYKLENKLKNNAVVKIIKKEDEPNIANISFHIPKQYHKREALILVVCRIQFNGDQYIPLLENDKDTARYLASIHPTIKTNGMRAGVSAKEYIPINDVVISNSLTNILSKKVWK